MLLLAFAHLPGFSSLDVSEFAFESRSPLLNDSPIDFELLFARPAGADADDASHADDAFEVVPHGAQPRIGVFELRQFDLQLRFARRCPAGKDVED